MIGEIKCHSPFVKTYKIKNQDSIDLRYKEKYCSFCGEKLEEKNGWYQCNCEKAKEWLEKR